MMTPTKNNIQQYAIGKQIDLAIGTGANATSGTNYFSVKEFDAPYDPKIVNIEDAEGNRTTNSYTVVGDREHPFSFSGSTDVTKIGLFAYLASGVESVTQDGSTGAYEHVLTMLNNVVLPQFTIFTQFGAEGYRRLTGCTISKLTITVTDTEAMFKVEGFALSEDRVYNSSSSLAALVVSAIAYQSGSTTLEGSIMRYSFSGSPTLTSVNVNDVLHIPAATTGISNAVNIGDFLVVAKDNTAKTIDVINNSIYDNSKDESSITSSAISVIHVNTPVYPTPLSILLRRHSAVYDAANSGALSSATAVGLKNFELTINNNGGYLFEKPKSPDPLAVISHNIQVDTKFTQVMDYNNAMKAIASRELSANNKAYRFELEDTSVNLGTSTTYHPLIQVTLPQALGIGTRTGMGKNDQLSYDWTLNTSSEQATQIVLRNTTASYAF